MGKLLRLLILTLTVPSSKCIYVWAKIRHITQHLVHMSTVERSNCTVIDYNRSAGLLVNVDRAQIVRMRLYYHVTSCLKWRRA